MVSKSRTAGSQSVRIIGGKWRRRRLEVPAGGTVRPTPDRVRETLFNWLGPAIAGRSCLDLFAGTGALGFEAASRGAREVVMIERDRHMWSRLNDACGLLGASEVEVVNANALAWLDTNQRRFDIVFADPPFDSDLLRLTCERLSSASALAPEALIYLESRQPVDADGLPDGWVLHKSGKAGQVRYHLASC